MFLVLLETSGNQNYIFSTNKLKENIGASDLTYRAGTQWVLEIVGKINQTPSLEVWKDSDRLRQNLLNLNLNPPIGESNKPVEIIIATSGKALLLTQDEITAKNIIKQITQRALKEAPGIDLCGVFVEFKWNEKGNLAEALKKLYKKFSQVHSEIPYPGLRFLRLPILEDCQNSEFPASHIVTNPQQKKVALSEISWKKQQQIDEAIERLNYILKNNKEERKFIKNVNQLDQKFQNIDWLAVVHADGNGLGQIFLNFQDYIAFLNLVRYSNSNE